MNGALFIFFNLGNVASEVVITDFVKSGFTLGDWSILAKVSTILVGCAKLSFIEVGTLMFDYSAATKGLGFISIIFRTGKVGTSGLVTCLGI